MPSRLTHTTRTRPAATTSHCPDGLGVEKGGRLWRQTDGDSRNAGDFAGMGNNQMRCADPNSGEIRRFMVGPVG
ncbi:hypothetical protein B1218_38200, partial [Pseudomonas ogarae]